MIAASIIHFYYISSTAWAWLYVISCLKMIKILSVIWANQFKQNTDRYLGKLSETPPKKKGESLLYGFCITNHDLAMTSLTAICICKPWTK